MSELTGKYFLVDLCFLKVVTCRVNKCLESTTVFSLTTVICGHISAEVKEFLSAWTLVVHCSTNNSL